MTDYEIVTGSEYEISIESPVHIGSGDELNPMDFVFHNGRIFVIELDKVLSEMEDKGVNPLVLYDEIERFGARFDFRQFLGLYGIDIGKVSKYSVSCDEIPKSIRTFIKNAFGVPLIPGSSIKGAIRTALLWYFLRNEDKTKVEEAVRRVFRKLNQIRESKERIRASKKWEREIGGELENLVFYGKEKKPNFDLNKALGVADAHLQSCDQLEVVPCRVFTTTRENTLEPKAFDIFLEAVKPSPGIAVTKISLSKYFMEMKSSDLGFKMNQIDILGRFPEICNEFSKEIIEYELDFFEKYNLFELAQFYEKLHKSLPQTDDEFLLKLGFGTGWISMTVGLLLKDNPRLMEDIRREFWLGRTKIPPYYFPDFPKTRKIITGQNRPKYSLGWIRMRKPHK